MKSINMGRVFLGGLLAGVIVNISEWILNGVVLKTAHEEAMKALNKAVPMSGSQMAVWVLIGFVFGIAAIWLYAAIRPRYGPGPGTAARAGIAAWFFMNLYSTIVMANMGLFQGNALVVAAIWTLVQWIVATVVGAWAYKEETAPTVT